MSGLRIFCFAIFLSLGAKAGAQFSTAVESDESRANDPFAQASSFENPTTKHDGLEFSLTRLVVEPDSQKQFRLIGRISNSQASPKRLLLLDAIPYLVDELGNGYRAIEWVGFDACRINGNVSSAIRDCQRESSRSLLAAPGVSATFSIVFGPNVEPTTLHDLANYVEFRARMAVSSSGFTSEEEISVWKLAVPRVPLPRSAGN